MVKNTECLNTTNCCVFKCSNVSNATTVINSRRCSKGMSNIIYFLQITEEKKLYREYFGKLFFPDTTKVALKIGRNIEIFK